MSAIVALLREQRRHGRQLESIEAREIVPVVARYTTNAGQSIPNNTVTVVNYEDQDFDPRSAVTVGAGWVFTCPVAGYYLVTAKVQFAASTAWANGELLALDVYVAAAQVARVFANEMLGSTASAEASAQGNTIVHLDKGDTLDIRVLQVSGGARTLTADGNENHVSIGRVTP